MTLVDMFAAAPLESIVLPQLEVIRTHPLGQIRHAIRGEQSCAVTAITEVNISARIKQPLFHLDNGESVVVTQRRKVDRPEGVDGVLQAQDDGTYSWLSHRLVEAFEADVEARGLPVVAAEIAKSWDNSIRFKVERPSADGRVEAGSEGLRPPQLGALHAIGAHWSLSKQPATIVMPTGTGKTETMLAVLAAYVRGPLLVVVPWDLLRGQTGRKFLTFGLLRKLGVLSPEASNPIVGIITHRPSNAAQLDIFESCNVIIATAGALSVATALPLAAEIARRS